MNRVACIFISVSALAASSHSYALDWSDTSVGYRYGTQFREPFNRRDIAKNIVNFTHVDAYTYGTNYLNIDFLVSDSKDPAALESSKGAHEAYVTYRHTFDFGKISGTNLSAGPIRGAGLTLGFDWNTKTDVGYNSRKRMLVAGPTLMFDVPGFLNVSLLALWESNAPSGLGFATGTPVPYSVDRYRYRTHPDLNISWGIPLGAGVAFEGYGDFIASKGKDEFGNQTAPETHFDAKLMYDLSPHVSAKKDTLRIGFEYEYWKNKFGNDHRGPAGSGAVAKTPMIRVEYHF